MATDTNPGHAFRIHFGEVTDCSNDPTQSRQCRVKLQSGSGQQTDQIDTQNLPWYPVMNHSGNPALKGGVGGSLTSLKVGSRVMMMSIGDQDMVIMGSVTAMGNGQPDSTQNFDSALPPHDKQSQNGGVSQPNYGDKSLQMAAQDQPDSPQQVQTQDKSIWELAETQLGSDQNGKEAKYAGLKQDLVANVPAMNAGGFGQTMAGNFSGGQAGGTG